jgi:hypothetical protein
LTARLLYHVEAKGSRNKRSWDLAKAPVEDAMFLLSRVKEAEVAR